MAQNSIRRFKMSSETITRNDLKAVLDEVLPSTPTIADYVVEQGVSGMWTYRKWASGIAECWGNNTVASSTFFAWGSVYYSATYSTVSFPTDLFVDTPTLTTTALSGPDSWVARSGTVTKNSAGSAYLVRGATSTAYPYTIGYHAIGRWK